MKKRFGAGEAIWNAVVWPALIGVLPYPDIRRRLRMRREAAQLITCSPWPGNSASGLDLARLALQRALWLQRTTHRAARHPEAAALLARVALENCFVGLYCIYSDDPLTQMRGGNKKSLVKMLRSLERDEIVTQELVDSIEAEIGGSGKLPTVKDMATAIASALDNSPIPLNLYGRLYIPLSEFFVHTNGTSLLRHVGDQGVIQTVPDHPWLRRGSVRAADASVGILAAAVAKASGSRAEQFAEYADDHLARTLAPLAVVGGKGILRAIGPSRLVAFALGLVELRSYVVSGRAAADEPEQRALRIRRFFESHLGEFGDIPDEVRDQIIERVVSAITATIKDTEANTTRNEE